MTLLTEIIEYFGDLAAADGNDNLRRPAMVALESTEKVRKWANLIKALEEATRVGLPDGRMAFKARKQSLSQRELCVNPEGKQIGSVKNAKASLVDEQEAAAILAKQREKAISLGLPACWWAFQYKNNRSWFYRNTDEKRF
jgi:hypothetical protein